MAQALDHPILQLTFVANADMTANAYKLLRHTSGERLGLCAAGGAGFVGVLYKVEHDPGAGAAGDELSVMVEGVAVMRTGGAFDPGDKITSDGSGLAVEAASTNEVIGRALEASTGSGQYVAVLITREGVLA